MILTRSFPPMSVAMVALIVSAPACRAGDDENKTIEVRVVEVLASSKNNQVDKKLECLAKEVQKIEPSLTGFRLKRCTLKELRIGDKVTVPLVEDESIEISIQGSHQDGPGNKDRVQLTVKPPTLGKIVYASCCSKYFPIVTRYETKDKERLILAICVHCCDKK